jgi:hypothetical protein
MVMREDGVMPTPEGPVVTLVFALMLTRLAA